MATGSVCSLSPSLSVISSSDLVSDPWALLGFLLFLLSSSLAVPVCKLCFILLRMLRSNHVLLMNRVEIFTLSRSFSEKFLSQLWTQQKFVLEEHCYYSAHLEYILGLPSVHSCWWLEQGEETMAHHSATSEPFLLLFALPIIFLFYSGANISTSLENSSGVLHPSLWKALVESGSLVRHFEPIPWFYWIQTLYWLRSASFPGCPSCFISHLWSPFLFGSPFWALAILFILLFPSNFVTSLAM